MTAPPLLIAAAPNGAYKTRRDHPALPITPQEIAETAAAVAEAGARMLHLHVRDAHGAHTLDINAYRAAIRAIREKAGGDLFIQATSESAGAYSAAEQREALYALGGGREESDSADTPPAPPPSPPASPTPPEIDGVSIAPRELIRAESDAAPAAELFRHLRGRGILIQYILYSPDDVARYKSLLAQEVIPPDLHSILLVVGRHDAASPLPALRKMLEALRAAPPAPANWMTCAFGADEFACLRESATLGGHIRAGFENTLLLRSGRPAADNRELITQLLKHGNPQNRAPATPAEAREILGAA